MNRSPSRSASAVVVVVLTVVVAGCSSSKPPETRGQKMVEGFERTKAGLMDAQLRVETTLSSLNHVRYTGRVGGPGATVALSDAFNAYRKAVDQLEKEAVNVKRRAESMRESADANQMAWQKEMESIKDPQVKSSLQARRDAVRTNYKQVRMYADDARKAYEPFLQANKDIIKALSIDLSPAAVAGLEPAIERTLNDGRGLQQRIAAVQHAMMNIENGVAPIGDAAAP